jgi:filamentous hemagglutinin
MTLAAPVHAVQKHFSQEQQTVTLTDDSTLMAGRYATRSGISGGTIVVTDEAGQQSRTGQSATETVASLNRDVATGVDTSGRIGNNFNRQEIEAGFAVTGAFAREVGTYLQLNAAEADAKKKAANDPALNLTEAQRSQLQAEAREIERDWGPTGTYRQIATALVAAASGNVSGSSGQFAQAALVNYVQQQGAAYIGRLVADGTVKEDSPAHAALHE